MFKRAQDLLKPFMQQDAVRAEDGVSTTGIVVAVVLIILAIGLGIAAHPLFFALIVIAIILLFVL